MRLYYNWAYATTAIFNFHFYSTFLTRKHNPTYILIPFFQPGEIRIVANITVFFL